MVTGGTFRDYPPRLYLDEVTHSELEWLDPAPYQAEWEDPLWKAHGAQAIAALAYAQMIFTLPSSLFSTAIAQSSLVDMSQDAKDSALAEHLSRALRQVAHEHLRHVAVVVRHDVQIAVAVGWTPNSVRVALTRARHALRACVDRAPGDRDAGARGVRAIEDGQHLRG